MLVCGHGGGGGGWGWYGGSLSDFPGGSAANASACCGAGLGAALAAPGPASCACGYGSVCKDLHWFCSTDMGAAVAVLFVYRVAAVRWSSLTVYAVVCAGGCVIVEVRHFSCATVGAFPGKAGEANHAVGAWRTFASGPSGSRPALMGVRCMKPLRKFAAGRCLGWCSAVGVWLRAWACGGQVTVVGGHRCAATVVACIDPRYCRCG